MMLLVFPSSGTILIEEELVEYSSKVSNYLLGCIRGTNGTIAVPHSFNSRVYLVNSSLLGIGKY
jgi:hypothetical protein